jgi:hydroxymethylpyrimidine pyrophosphatase-like HAD family hydrolase
MQNKYPNPKWIYIDVDGTVVVGSIINRRLIEWLKIKKANGFKLVLWSSAGDDHARCIAEFADIVSLFDFIISKPGFIVDDQEWQWTKYVKINHICTLEQNADQELESTDA